MGQPWGIYYIVINQTMVKASTSDVLLIYSNKMICVCAVHDMKLDIKYYGRPI